MNFLKICQIISEYLALFHVICMALVTLPFFLFRARWLFCSKNMDPRGFPVEKHGSARFSGGKTWIRAFFWWKNMDPRVFRVEKHGSARSSGGKT